MSVIIRLQNLPWAANAADIRQYFQGLSIPEGGVHIVGGEKGDVFISFSTDEDARQAMLSDGGCIKDVQIRLLLSSRNEMQKVIDAARQQTLYNAYMQQNLMQQPQIPIVGSLPPLTAKVLPQPQQQVRQGPQMLHRPNLIDNMSVLIPQDKQQLQMQQQVLSPKSLESRDRDDKSHKQRSDRSRSKSRERRSKSSRSGGSRRDRSRSRDRRRRDRSRGRDRSRDRYRGGDGRSSTSRGSGGKSQRSRSPIANKATDGTLPVTQQSQINPWTCQYDNSPQQQAVENHQPAATMMNNAMPGGLGGFSQFRTPPQPPIIPVILPQNSSFHQQQQQQQQQPPPLMNNVWTPSGGNRSNQQQPPYVPDNDFRATVYGGGGSDDEDDRQTEFDNNFHGKYNENSGPGMRRGPPGQDFREQRGFGPNRGGPRFHKPQQIVPPVGQHNRGGGGGQRPFDEFGNGGGGGHRFNHQQQQQQPPRYGGHNIPDGGGRGRPSRFSSINENGKPSRFNQVPPQQQQPHRDNDEGGSVEFDESCKRMPPRYNDRYRYDVRNAQVPHAEGLCVEVNNMSNPFSYGDIRKLFEGIHIDGSAIKIQKHRQGVAFVRFDNNNNKNLALKVNGTAYKGNHVVVKHLDDEAYERDNTDDRPYPKATAAPVPNIVDHVDLVDDDDDDEGVARDQPGVSSDKKKSNKSKTDDDEGTDNDNDLVVCEKISNKDGASVEGGSDEQPRKDPPTKYLKLKQLPVTVTEEDVMNEFDGGTDVRRVVFYPDGEFMGAALEFTSTEAAESALKRYDCVLLGSTPVPVLRCTYKEYSQVKRKSGGDDGDDRRFSGGGGDNNSNSSSRHHHHSGSHHHHHHGGSSNHHQHSPVPVAPPPPNVAGAAPVTRSNCLYVYGLPTNVTNTDITQFFSDAALPDKIHIMLSKYGRPTGESYCEFGTAQQANTALGKNQCYMGQNVVGIEPINRSLMIQAITKPMQQHCNNQDMSWGGPPSRHQQHHQRPPQSQQYGGGPYGGGGGGGRPQQQQFNMNNGGGRGGYTPRIRGPGPGGPNTGPDGFGQPGCVVALDNVPYRADVQQIVDFFEGFELHSQNVIRRFNDFGKPTGEARVNLRNPQDAARAVRVLQNKPIFNRPVRLTLL